MNNGFGNNSTQSKDTLLFLINEFFLNANLSSIELSSEKQDEQISSLMNNLHQQSLAIDSIKASLYNDKQFNSYLNFSTSTFTQSSYANGSPLKGNYKRLFNRDSNANKSKKIVLKSNANTTGKKSTIFHGLCLTDSNTNNNNKTICKTIYRFSQNKKRNCQDINYTINYSTYEKKNHYTNRSDFKFEPKKKELMSCIKNADMKTGVATNKIAGSKNKNKSVLPIKTEYKEKISPNSRIIKLLFSDQKNEAILKTLFQFVDIKNNNLRSISNVTRTIYLEELLVQTQRKIDILSSKNNLNETHENQNKEIIDTSSSTIDNKMEIEILRHIEAKLSEFAMKSK